jgi:3-methyladenine DNA glycosylase AlkD
MAASIERQLLPHGDPARRAFLAGGYARTQLRWMGVPIPALRRVVVAVSRALKGHPARTILELAQALADRGSIEVRQAGYEILARHPGAMALLTRARLERLGSGNDNWAVVDAFATSVAGPAWRFGHITDADVLRWARSRDVWWRRTAIVSTVALNVAARGGRGDVDRTLRVVDASLHDLTPMLAKALSWALRSAAPHDPVAVRAFVDAHDDLPALVRREVVTRIVKGVKVQRKVR